ncbi:hypothetical protein [Portibacter lacus]|uniref:hypothetical protein n=1 Tax=Portibacter lacus TaxID=1099794 RepID=UPI001F3356FC|nr:hypothetical protein [Portibacter lacus]
MKRSYCFLAILFVVLFSSCEKKTLPVTEEFPSITFQVEFIKGNEGYKSEVKSFNNRREHLHWAENHDGTYGVFREVTYDIILENGEEMEFGFMLLKNNVNKDLLIVEDWSVTADKSWEFVSFEDEKTNFFENYDEARILIGYNVIFYKSANEDFNVIEVDSKIENGVKTSYAKIEFQGSARGFYDPEATSGEFILTNGKLTDLRSF